MIICLLNLSTFAPSLVNHMISKVVYLSCTRFLAIHYISLMSGKSLSGLGLGLHHIFQMMYDFASTLYDISLVVVT